MRCQRSSACGVNNTQASNSVRLTRTLGSFVRNVRNVLASVCEVWGSNNGVNGESNLLECDAVSNGKWLPASLELQVFLDLKMEAEISSESRQFYEATRRRIPGGLNFRIGYWQFRFLFSLFLFRQQSVGLQTCFPVAVKDRCWIFGLWIFLCACVTRTWTSLVPAIRDTVQYNLQLWKIEASFCATSIRGSGNFFCVFDK